MFSLLQFDNFEKTSDTFRRELVRMGGRLRLDPNGISGVISLESGYDPSNWNNQCEQEIASGKKAGPVEAKCAVGLIQFMPDTARNLGTTSLELSKMSAVEQLAYVEKFFRPYAGRLDTPSDFYMAVFNPANIGKSSSFILYRRGSEGYRQNQGFDKNGQGVITVGDVTRSIEAAFARALKRPTVEVDETIAVPLVARAGALESPSSSGASPSGLSSSLARKRSPRDVETLTLGDTGRAVQLWRRLLGLEGGVSFDALCYMRTTEFQAKKGLVVDGIVGPKTWDAMIAGEKP